MLRTMTQRSTRSKTEWICGVDVGGTFTDFFLLQGDGVTIHKVPSTPEDQSLAVLEGLQALKVIPPGVVVHGTTVATNALLERKGAKTALITSLGCRDVLEIGRQTRLNLYGLIPQRPEPLVPRSLRFEVPERLDWQGQTLVPLDEEELDRALEEARAQGATSVAICFLFSFLNPSHEQRAVEKARAKGFWSTASSEVVPEYREYERMSTTVMNAYVGPVMSRYLQHLQKGLFERGPFHLRLMQSNGGLLSPEKASQQAVRTILSGPAGGVVATYFLGCQRGEQCLIGLDMGGTSTDVSIIDGEPLVTTEGTIGDLPVKIPLLEIHTVGAGGGSIARVDRGGALQVGPESAGADPGPSAYGKSFFPTVTDANFLLGRLLPDFFLGGRMKVFPERSRETLEKLSQQIGGLTAEETAEGVLRVATARMARAIRRISAQKGRDPSYFTLVAFGGSGPLHACEVAEQVGISSILIPPYPGVFSAIGLALADILLEYSLSRLWQEPPSPKTMKEHFEPLITRALEDLKKEQIGSYNQDALLKVEKMLDVRYRGQSYEITVPLKGYQVASAIRQFHQKHRELYGFSNPSWPVEIVTLRVRALLLRGQQLPPMRSESKVSGPATPLSEIPVYHRQWLKVPLYERESLSPGTELLGPLLIAQADATTWVPPGWRTKVDSYGNLILQKGFEV